MFSEAPHLSLALRSSSSLGEDGLLIELVRRVIVVKDRSAETSSSSTVAMVTRVL